VQLLLLNCEVDYMSIYCGIHHVKISVYGLTDGKLTPCTLVLHLVIQVDNNCVVRCKNRESVAFYLPLRACKQPLIVTV
jgi:hypothetical protein